MRGLALGGANSGASSGITRRWLVGRELFGRGLAGRGLAGRNPVAKVAAALILSVAALLTVDALTPALIAGAVILVALVGGHGRVVARGWPILVGALSVAIANSVFGGTVTGPVVLAVGPVELHRDAAMLGAALGIRVIAIALPGYLALAGTDPTDLADALVQQLRAPARFAYGALAALRMLPLLSEEWRIIGLARRARGISAASDPLRAPGLLAGRIFALLVGAIRRATRVAAAMDTRGFDSKRPRTYARRQRFRAADLGLIAGSVVLAGAATITALTAGTWTPLLS